MHTFFGFRVMLCCALYMCTIVSSIYLLAVQTEYKNAIVCAVFPVCFCRWRYVNSVFSSS